MRLKAHKVEKLAGDRMTVKGVWTNQMRQPRLIRVAVEEAPNGEMDTILEGDAADVYHTLEGLAQIAWGLGWRPAGLSNAVAGVVAAYRLPAAG